MQGKLGVMLAGLVLAASVAAATAASATAGSEPPAEAEAVKMKLGVSAERFHYEDGRVFARGPVSMRTDGEGVVRQRTEQRVELKLRKGGAKCTVLDLHLAELFVALLGLEVTTSEINLQITGDGKKALGRLFCQLSKGLKVGNKRLARDAVHSLNRRLDGRPMRLVRINATLHPQTIEADPARRAPGDGGPRCQILDVDIGPLELDLLGLMVDLYGATKKSPVHVDADADPNGGAVGKALCEVSSGPARQAS